jgi:hypothetical protein
LLNVTFPPSYHLVELQLNLKALVDVESGGGHVRLLRCRPHVTGAWALQLRARGF